MVTYADKNWINCVSLCGDNDMHAKIVNNGTFAINGELDMQYNTEFDNNGTVVNNRSIFYEYVLGDTLSKECDEIENVVGNGTAIRRAYILSQSGLKDAFSRRDGDELFFTEFYLESEGTAPGFVGSYVMPVTDFSLTGGRKFIISKGATFTIPAGSTFTIEEDAAMQIDGTLTVNGKCNNKGYYSKPVSGTIVGGITTTENGDYSLELEVTTETEFINAANYVKCYAITVANDISVSSNIEVHANLIINEGKTLTIDEGMTLDLYRRRDNTNNAFNIIYGNLINKGTLNIYEQLNVAYTGQLKNEGTLTLNNGTGIFVANDGFESEHHGLLDNSAGIIHIYSGWLEYRDNNGDPTPWFKRNETEAVRTYSNLADVARELYYRQQDESESNMLDTATQSDIDTYKSKYVDWSELDNEYNSDTDGIIAISMLLKNGVIKPAGTKLFPYGLITKVQAIEMVYNFTQVILTEHHKDPINVGEDVTFNDVDGLTEAQKTAIAYLAKAGLLKAENDKFNPDEYILNVVGEKVNGVFIEDYAFGDLCRKLMEEICSAEAEATNLDELKAALASPRVPTVRINGNITLDDDTVITKELTIPAGSSLTTCAEKTLTVGFTTATDYAENEYMTSWGRVTIEGTLNVAAGSTLVNTIEIRIENGGTLNAAGTYTDTADGATVNGKPQLGFMEANESTLTSSGNFTNNGTVRLIGSTFTHTAGTYTNNDSLEITGGSVEVSSSFINNGRFSIEDVYDAQPTICAFTASEVKDHLTGLNPLEYVALAYTAEGLKKALVFENNYDRIGIMDDIALDADMTIGADLLIEQGCVLVVPAGVTLSFTGESQSIVNNGEIQVEGTLVKGSATVTGTGAITEN